MEYNADLLGYRALLTNTGGRGKTNLEAHHFAVKATQPVDKNKAQLKKWKNRPTHTWFCIPSFQSSQKMQRVPTSGK
jgi:uncharacterized protein YlaI